MVGWRSDELSISGQARDILLLEAQHGGLVWPHRGRTSSLPAAALVMEARKQEVKLTDTDQTPFTSGVNGRD